MNLLALGGTDALLHHVGEELVLYSLYWVFLGGFRKKEVQKGKIVATSL